MDDMKADMTAYQKWEHSICHQLHGYHRWYHRHGVWYSLVRNRGSKTRVCQTHENRSERIIRCVSGHLPVEK